jgi:hypothetical protein
MLQNIRSWFNQESNLPLQDEKTLKIQMRHRYKKEWKQNRLEEEKKGK